MVAMGGMARSAPPATRTVPLQAEVLENLVSDIGDAFVGRRIRENLSYDVISSIDRQKDCAFRGPDSYMAIVMICLRSNTMTKPMTGSDYGSSMRNVERRRFRAEMRAKLREYSFTHFITLATNHQQLSYGRMRSLLKQWDARVNRALIGPKWTKRPDERIIWFAFPEKLDVNPHWHLLLEVDPLAETLSRRWRTDNLSRIARNEWLRLVPSGSFDCQAVASADVIDYVLKCMTAGSYIEQFVVSREFVNN